MIDKRRAARAKRQWRCEGCGEPLPRTGCVWRFRFAKFEKRCVVGTFGSGWYCDVCTDAREQGVES